MVRPRTLTERPADGSVEPTPDGAAVDGSRSAESVPADESPSAEPTAADGSRSALEGRRGFRFPVGAILPVSILLAWFAVATWDVLPDYLLPAPQDVAVTGWYMLVGGGAGVYGGTLLQHAWATLVRVGLGFGLAVLVGLPLGLLTGRWRSAARFFDPTVHALRSIPGIAWLGLAIVWFGIGMGLSLFLISLAAFFPIYLNSAQGAASIPTIWIRAGRMLGAGRWDLFRGIVLPGAAPSVIAGLRLGLGISWAYVVLGELTGQSLGLGATIMNARMAATGQLSVIIVAMVAIGLLGRLSDRLLMTVAGRMVYRPEG